MSSDDELRPDDYRGTIDVRLPKQRIRELSQIHELRGVLHVLGEWLAIGFSILLCEQLAFNPWLYVAMVAFIGGRQHALFHLAHEATHYHLFRRRSLNDLLGDAFLAWPCLHSIPLYRQRHFGHHRHIGTLDDPHIDETYAKNPSSWRFPKTRLELALWLLRRLLGLTFPRYVKAFLRGFPKATWRGQLALKVGYYLVLIGAIGAAHGFRILFLYWIVPLATWTPMIRDLRLAAEHFAIDGEEDPNGTKSRSVSPNLLERIVICSKSTYFHSEHHDYPSVPFYHLPQLHREMRANPQLEPRLHCTDGYWRVLCQLSGQPSASERKATRANA